MAPSQEWLFQGHLELYRAGFQGVSLLGVLPGKDTQDGLQPLTHLGTWGILDMA